MNRQSKKSGRKLLSMLLVLIVLLSGSRMTALAETISGNEAAAGESQAGMSEEGMEDSDSLDELQDEADVLQELVYGSTSENNLPVNPVYDTENDTTTWSYVYFGSYPQSKVTDRDTINAIDKAMSVSGNSADEGMDVWVNGTKYRRISGYYDTDSYISYRYFKWERIKWRVLQNDGNTLFVVADKAIEGKGHKDEDASVTWETSYIRDWLNGSFYNTAFSSSEQGAIVTQNVENEDNPYGTEGGNNTNDNIYLLSISEVTNETYGFYSDMSRRMKASDYANKWSDASSGYGYDWWWLRSPGYFSNSAAYVRASGYVDCDGEDVFYGGGVCPALHINLSSGIWSMADDGTSGEGGNSGGDREEEILKGLQISKKKTEYVQGEQLNLDDLTVTAVYVNSSEVLQAGAYTTNAADINMNTPGSYTLEISYIENGVTKKATLTITVKAKTGGTTQQPGSNPQPQPVKVTKLTITAPSKKLAAGKKIKLTLKAIPSNATDKTVTWKSSNTKYATVDKNGKVTLKATGAGKTVTITAAANDGSGKKASVKLKIMKHAVKSIKLIVPAKTLKTGKSMSIKATVKTTGSSANKTLKWTSSNTKYATVKSGKVTAKKAGKGKTVTIMAASTDGSGKKATVKIKIK